MTTKEKIKQILINNQGHYISGEEIAQNIHTTRACVWKNIKSLESEGLLIDAVTNKGYRLQCPTDAPNASAIEKSLRDKGLDISVEYFDEVTSTNELLKEYAKTNHNEKIIIAGLQTAGKGRKGRNFYSPMGTGLYFSILLFPNDKLDKIVNITAMTAVATALALDEVVFNGEDTTLIKWVNDVYINDKKISGILTEGYSSFESSEDNYIVIGIGINLYPPTDDFPKDIKDKAGWAIDTPILDKDIATIKSELVIKITETVMRYYDFSKTGALNPDDCLTIYRNKSNLMGSYVKINHFDGNYTYARVIGISDDYHLIVEYDDKSTEELSSGEVSVVKY